MIIGILILIALIIFLLKYFSKDKNNEDMKNDYNEKDETILEPIEVEKVNNQKNYFIASYKSVEGEDLKLFNPSRLGLTKDDFEITLLDKNLNNLRRIDERNNTNNKLKSGIITSEKTGILNFFINITNPLKNLDFMFEDCENLLSVDLSIESPINSMTYTFANCKNLENVNLTSLNSSKVEKMEFLFSDCKNLVDIKGLDLFNTTSVKKTAGMFFGCNSLSSLNLSSFNIDKIGEQRGMFVNTQSLKNLELGNCTDANKIFNPSENYNNLIIKGNESIIDQEIIHGISFINDSGLFGFHVTCDIGEKEKCKKCDKASSDCEICNEGYFLPLGGETKRICKKCDEGCIECYAEENSNNSTCISCGEGYYLDENNTKKCKKIEIDNCLEVFNEENNFKCKNCSEGYFLYEGQCAKLCEIGKEEKCSSCNTSFEFMDKCNSCNKGYILNNKNNNKICQSCSELINHCQECQFLSGDIQCLSCNEGYTLFNNFCFRNCNDNCNNCSFDESEAKYGKCKSCDEGYFLRSTYGYHDDFGNIPDTFCNRCPTGCKSCIYDELFNKYKCLFCYENYKLNETRCQKECDFGENEKCLKCKGDKCESCNPGYYLSDGKCHSCNINNCIECDINKNCNKCENGYKLEENKCIKQCNVGSNEKCKECNSLNKLECSSCNNGYFLPNDSSDKTKCMPCDEGCKICNGNLIHKTCFECKYGFKLNDEFKCETKCKIGDGELCLTCDYSTSLGENCEMCNPGYYLPEKDEDRKKCKKCGINMEKCHEKEENGNKIIIPDKCIFPYVISGNYCLKQCVKGKNEKCNSCSEIPGKIYQCGSCNIGYYLPKDSEQKECSKCEEGCEICEGTKKSSICSKCNNNYMLFNGKCIKNCEVGDNEKCKKCKDEEGFNYQCENCNIGYYLPNNSNDFNKINYFNYSKCLKCPNYCKSCNGNYNNPICNDCISDEYYLENGVCIKGAECSEKGNCLECIGIDGNSILKKCNKCKDGFYLPKNRKRDENFNKCYQCSIPGCTICEGENELFNICSKCTEGLEALKINGQIITCYRGCDLGENEKCKSCDKDKKCSICNDDYELKNGECVSISYDFLARYETTSKNEELILMKNIEIKQMEVDGKIISNPLNTFTFENPGLHNVSIKLASFETLSLLFSGNKKLKSIIFWDNKETEKVSLMNDLFNGCSNLEYVDMSRLKWGNNKCLMNMFKDNLKLKEVKFPRYVSNKVYWFYGMFEGCKSLEVVDMPSLYDTNGEYFYDMFKGCSKLNNINIPNFKKDCSKCDLENMFDGINTKGLINVGSQSYINLINKDSRVWAIIKSSD